MKLFANGCSFTWGGALFSSLYSQDGNLLDYHNPSAENSRRLRTVWPGQLAQLLNVEHVNLSIGSGSNDRIVRTTLDFFTKILNKNIDPSEYFACIQWTQSPRFEYHDEFLHTWAMCLPTGSMSEKKASSRDIARIDKLKDLFYGNTTSRSYSEKYFQQIVTLSCFFEKHNVQYCFSNLDRQVLEHLEMEQQLYLKQNMCWLNNDPYYYFDRYFDDLHESNSGHPSEIGHKQIASNIHALIKDKF